LRLPAIIATPIRGKQGGTRALCQGRASYTTTHTFRSAEHGELTVPVTVARTYKRRRSGRRSATWCLYVCLSVHAPVGRIRKRYRRRFGVESSYRLMEQVRARTTSPKRGVTFHADGSGVADREYVDTVALAVPTYSWTGTA